MMINISRINTQNIGDVVCAPWRYVSSENIENIDIDSADGSESERDAVIVGGGGLLLSTKHERIKTLEKLAQNKKYPLIWWGAGTNTHFGTALNYPDVLDRFDLVGVRDYGTGLFDYVPCASCMSPLFDRKYPITNEIGIYDNWEFPVPITGEYPRMNNLAGFEGVIRFLGSCETVWTSSYHGWYWATLMGRKVVLWPFSSKFYHLKYPALIAKVDNWKAKQRSYPEALDESRTLNNAFYQKVKNLL